ncbi:MAG TPA: hypothetical protein PLH94_01840 [Fimbriimonadaceae bacterium]|nr:hypothetical protein [Fimbriimonadaceae bacterium]
MASRSASTGNGANVGFDAELGKAAAQLRSNMDASEIKHAAPRNREMSIEADLAAEIDKNLAPFGWRL